MQQQGRANAYGQAIDAGHHRFLRPRQGSQEFLDRLANGAVLGKSDKVADIVSSGESTIASEEKMNPDPFIPVTGYERFRQSRVHIRR